MDEGNRYCLGCKRTLGEIARWSEMAEAERRTIIASLADRRSDLSESIPQRAD